MTITFTLIRLFLHILYFGFNTATEFVNLNEIATRNVKISGKVINVFRTIGFIKCARQCEALTSCHGFNYHKSNLVCELLSEQETDPIASEGWCYVNNTDWLKQKCLSKGMDQHTCGQREKKVKLSSGEVHCLKQDLPVDCNDNRTMNQQKSGVYTISPQGNQTFDVFCDFETIGGPWTVIQTRVDDSVSFNRTWVEYKNGFGKKTGTFWLGNDNMHNLLSASNYSLRVDMEFHDGAKFYAEYSTMYVAGENEDYKLTLNGYSGTAGDSFWYNDGMVFSTIDNDHTDRKCASLHSSGWWFNECFHCHLNGHYYNTYPAPHWLGILWLEIRTEIDSMTKVSMKVKEMKN